MDVQNAKAKLSRALTDIKANFKPDDGAVGVKKIQSMFVNLWKSGMNGKVALVGCSAAILLSLMIVCCGGGNSSDDIVNASVVAAKSATARANEALAAANAAAAREAMVSAAAAKAEAAVKRTERTASVVEESPSVATGAASKEMIEIKDVASAKKALKEAYASGDLEAVKKAQTALAEQEALAERAAEERAAKEAEEIMAQQKAEEERNAREEAERIAKKKAEIEAKKAAYEAIPKDLVVKGLYVRMPGDKAVEACEQLVAKGEDLEVLDYRKGIEREKDEETKAAEKKAWDALVKQAETDIESFQNWNSVDGHIYQPGARDCEGNIPDPHAGELFHKNAFTPRLDWAGSHRKATIPGASYTLATAMAALAGVYGYQVEWMLPGRRASKAKSDTSKTSNKQLVTIGSISSADFEKNQGLRGLVEMSGRGEMVSILGNKGLKLSEAYEGHAFCRLLYKDDAGKPIEKEDLATEIACNFPELFKKDSTRDEKVKLAANYVDALSEWVEGWCPDPTVAPSARIPDASKTGVQSTGKARTFLEYMLKGGRYNAKYGSMLKTLVQNCKATVELAVLAEPVERFEEITETFTIPATTYEAACKYVEKMDTNLGKYSDSIGSSDHSRKRYFFKHDLEDVRSPVWFRLVLKNTNGVEVTKNEAVNNWLNARGHYKPSDKVKIPPKNLIKVAVKQKGVAHDKLKGVCFVWTDEAGNVKETYFNEEGMGRLFDAKDLSGEEFAKLLVKNYPGLPSLNLEVEKKNPGRGTIQECTWTYSCPKGYQVKLFERSYINDNGVKYDSKMLERDAEVAMALSLSQMLPDKHLSITATKPESARKFD